MSRQVNPYSSIYRDIGVSDLLASVAAGEVSLLSPDLQAPFGPYGFPPGLIPLWSESSVLRYVGLWWHPFSGREAAFVRYSVAGHYPVREIARTETQLFAYSVLSAIGLHEGVTESIRALAERAGLDAEALDRVSLVAGDVLELLAPHAPFDSQTPLACLPTGEGYDGGAPHPAIGVARARDFSTLEVDVELRNRIAASAAPPAWFGNSLPQAVFARLLHCGDFAGAWCTLNSGGWAVSQARAAIAELVDASGHPMLSRVAAAWASVPHQAPYVQP